MHRLLGRGRERTPVRVGAPRSSPLLPTGCTHLSITRHASRRQPPPPQPRRQRLHWARPSAEPTAAAWFGPALGRAHSGTSTQWPSWRSRRHWPTHPHRRRRPRRRPVGCKNRSDAAQQQRLTDGVEVLRRGIVASAFGKQERRRLGGQGREGHSLRRHCVVRFHVGAAPQGDEVAATVHPGDRRRASDRPAGLQRRRGEIIGLGRRQGPLSQHGFGLVERCPCRQHSRQRRQQRASPAGRPCEFTNIDADP